MGYRHLPATKFMAGGKRRRYKNLATFNKECTKRSSRGNVCFLTNMRCLKDGGGLATVRSVGTSDRSKKSRYLDRPTGLWRLHFMSCSVMKRHLKGRTLQHDDDKRLDGARRRKRRR